MNQSKRVEQVLRDTLRPLALHEIHSAIRARYGISDSEAAISARIREIRHELEKSATGTVLSVPVTGKKYLRYRVWALPEPQTNLFDA